MGTKSDLCFVVFAIRVDKSSVAGHEELFKEMTAAYTVLSDASARAKYDRELRYHRFGNFYEN